MDQKIAPDKANNVFGSKATINFVDKTEVDKGYRFVKQFDIANGQYVKLSHLRINVPFAQSGRLYFGMQHFNNAKMIGLVHIEHRF